jgi:anthranilate synthase component 1
VFKYVIAINHFKDDLYVFEHRYDGEPADGRDGLTYLVSLIQNKNFPSYQFQTRGTESSNMTDEAFLEVLASGQKHCKLGDVFQIVLSRRFAQSFTGDEFNVYRALRSVNPSPYLFYFDFGSFKIFGSSPEAQITIKSRWRPFTRLPAPSAARATTRPTPNWPRNSTTTPRRTPNT